MSRFCVCVDGRRTQRRQNQRLPQRLELHYTTAVVMYDSSHSCRVSDISDILYTYIHFFFHRQIQCLYFTLSFCSGFSQSPLFLIYLNALNSLSSHFFMWHQRCARCLWRASGAISSRRRNLIRLKSKKLCSRYGDDRPWVDSISGFV